MSTTWHLTKWYDAYRPRVEVERHTDHEFVIVAVFPVIDGNWNTTEAYAVIFLEGLRAAVNAQKAGVAASARALN
jgi:hypothetical protein